MPNPSSLDPGIPTQNPTHELGAHLGRRALLGAAAAEAVGSGSPVPGEAQAAPRRRAGAVLQPGVGRTRCRYVPARVGEISWGKLPNRTSAPVAVVHSGAVVTMDTISHEGVLEDQGKDPRAFFESYGVPEKEVLRDAIAVAARDSRRPGAARGDRPDRRRRCRGR